MMQELMEQERSTVTFLPMLTDEARPWGRAWQVKMEVPSPIEEKWPIRTAFFSPLMVTLYQTVAHLLRSTSPISDALGATHASPVYGTAS